jgi:hypothetical protein
MKIIAIGMMALAISCGSTTTRHQGATQGGLTQIGTVQLEDMEFTISNLVLALHQSKILDQSKTVYFNKSGHSATSGVEDKTDTKMEANGHRIQLSNYLVNDLLKRKMCKVVTTDRGYDTANYSLKVLIVDEHVVEEDQALLDFSSKDQSNRIVIHFELYDISGRAETIAFASSEIVQKVRS